MRMVEYLKENIAFPLLQISNAWAVHHPVLRSNGHLARPRALGFLNAGFHTDSFPVRLR